MGRLRSKALWLAVAVFSFWSFGGCGGGTKPGPPIFPGRISLTPGGNTSLEVGGVLGFTASAATSSGTNISIGFTFTSSDTSILTLAPNGVACAGHWDVNYTVCTPGNIGPVQVTASTLGASSNPTWVFVHPPIDNITVTGVLLDGVPVQEPCLSQSQSMTVEARAFSHGADITSSVGPFTWSANNLGVVNLIPIVDLAYNFPTNQATAAAGLSPGITQIYASAGGVTSSSFLQPQLQNSQGNASPALDFFETCPIQKITLELGQIGSGQTSFVAGKGTGTETVYATITDIMGNSSLPNTNGGIVLSRVPLTWTASQPAVIGAGASCVESCSLSVLLPGSGSVSASCSPPSCNSGFPLVPTSLSSAAAVNACTQYFHTQYPQLASCQELIPVPVYADIAISGVVTGSASPVGVLATSTGCAHLAPAACSSSVYSFSTSKAATGSENPFPVSPNSLLYDLAGDRIFMGSDFGAQVINPANFGTTSSPYTALGTVTGSVLAVANNGTIALFSDTIHTPNQAYIVNVANINSPSATALNISSASAAAFSPDGLKTFILGGNSASSLYVYSTLQALQGPIALQGSGKSVGFSPNGGFAYIAESSSGAGSANLTAFATCSNQVATDPTQTIPAILPLPADPIAMRVLPQVHLDGRDSYGYTIPDGIHVVVLDATGFDIITSTIAPPASGSLCPQTLTFVPSPDPQLAVQRVELNQGTLQPPLNFFASADGSQLYIASGSNASILVYDFSTGGVTGIELIGTATPLSADMSADDGTILVAGSDGMLHEISTSLGGADLVQLPFPNLPNNLNPFCTGSPTQGPCTLNLVLAKP